jgi:hypothetical protein
MKKYFLMAALLLLFGGTAKAWPSCSGNWIQVPVGTSSANGAIVTENGQTFQCQPIPTPTPTPTAGNTNTNTNTNSNQNSNTSNSNANSNANAGAVAGSQSTATGGKATATGGNATSVNNVSAQGGQGGTANSSLNNSGNSSVTSTNTNTVAATGGQGGQGGAGGNAAQKQQQTQSSTSTASNNGNGSNNASYSNTENVAATKIPVGTAYAPTMGPTASCFKPFGAGVQTMPVGISFGAGRIDPNCVLMEDARSFAESGSRLAYCMMMVGKKEVRKAGITIEICMAQEPLEPVAAPPVPQPPVVVTVPAPVVEVRTPAPVLAESEFPVPQETHAKSTLLGVCSFARGMACAKDKTSTPQVYPGAACKKMLDEVLVALETNSNATLQIIGAGSHGDVVSVSRTNNVFRYFVEHGVSGKRIQAMYDSSQTSGTVELWLAQ